MALCSPRSSSSRSALAIGILDPEIEVWRQQWDTRLPGQLVDTAVLLVGVSCRRLPRQQPRLARQRLRFPGSKAFGWLLVAPLAMPSYVLGFVTMSVFGFTGPVQNQWRDWLVAMHGSPKSSRWVARSWSSRSCSTHTSSCWLAALADQAGSAYNVARSLGAGPLEAARRVVIPMLRPALAAGVAVVVMETITDFATVQFRRRHRDGRRLPHLAAPSIVTPHRSSQPSCWWLH